MPKRKLVVVADNTYAAIELLSRLTQLPNPVLWSLAGFEGGTWGVAWISP